MYFEKICKVDIERQSKHLNSSPHLEESTGNKVYKRISYFSGNPYISLQMLFSYGIVQSVSNLMSEKVSLNVKIIIQ